MKRLLFPLLALALACDDGPSATDAPAGEQRPRSEPVEFVGLSVQLPLPSAERARALLGPVFGEPASRGETTTNEELQPGLFLSAIPDERTPEQVVVQLEMETVADAERRVVLQVPASFAYGRTFIDAVEVALARAASVEAAGERTMEPFLLEYLQPSVPSAP